MSLHDFEGFRKCFAAVAASRGCSLTVVSLIKVGQLPEDGTVR